MRLIADQRVAHSTCILEKFFYRRIALLPSALFMER
jgi:hypothetical protein